MLKGEGPAVEIDGRCCSGYEEVLLALEREFGPLNGLSLEDDGYKVIKAFERNFFHYWVMWLNGKNSTFEQEEKRKTEFMNYAGKINKVL